MERLGFLDWGIGGVGIFRAFRQRRPEVPVLYWSDTGATPYGRLPAAELTARVRRVLRAMAGQGVTHAVDRLQRRLDHPAGPRRRRDSGDGGDRAGDRHGAACARRGAGRGGRRADDPLRPLPPGAGDAPAAGGPADRAAAVGAHRGRPRRHARRSNAIWGASWGRWRAPTPSCSPARTTRRRCEAFRRLAPRASLLDPAEAVVETLIARWRLPRGRGDLFVTTGLPGEMRRAARTAWGERPRSVRRGSDQLGRAAVGELAALGIDHHQRVATGEAQASPVRWACRSGAIRPIPPRDRASSGSRGRRRRKRSIRRPRRSRTRSRSPRVRPPPSLTRARLDRGASGPVARDGAGEPGR